jgi:Tfp pilus assembly protein PilO
MTSFLDKLNLRPGERRLVVIVALVVFVVLNVWLIWPQFGSVRIWQQRRTDALKKLQNFSNEVKNKPGYEKQLRDLESQGAFVGTEEQASTLSRDVANQATLSGVQVNRFDPAPRSSTGRTNAFFEEQTLIISIANTGERELVDFLYNLGARSSLIRVKSMTVSPDPTRMKLQGSITLVASFAKKPPPRVAAPPKATNQPPPKTTPTPAKPTNAPAAPRRDTRGPSTTKA